MGPFAVCCQVWTTLNLKVETECVAIWPTFPLHTHKFTKSAQKERLPPPPQKKKRRRHTHKDEPFICYYYYWSLLYSAVLRSQADSLRSHVILHEWIAFYSAFLNIHRSGVLTALLHLFFNKRHSRDSDTGVLHLIVSLALFQTRLKLLPLSLCRPSTTRSFRSNWVCAESAARP